MEQGIMIYSEDELDSMFEESPFDNEIVPGRNIKTGSYGLFLCALDMLEDTTELNTIREAMECVENIIGCTAICALTVYYPPDDLSPENILKLAEAFIYLNDNIPHLHAADIPNELINEVELKLGEILDVKSGAELLLNDEVSQIQHVKSGPKQLELFEDAPKLEGEELVDHALKQLFESLKEIDYEEDDERTNT